MAIIQGWEDSIVQIEDEWNTPENCPTVTTDSPDSSGNSISQSSRKSRKPPPPLNLSFITPRSVESTSTGEYLSSSVPSDLMAPAVPLETTANSHPSSPSNSANNKKDNLQAHRGQITCIIENALYIGDETVAYDLDLLTNNKITSIINAAPRTCQCKYPDKFSYYTIDLDDSPMEDIMCNLYSVIDFVDLHIYGRPELNSIKRAITPHGSSVEPNHGDGRKRSSSQNASSSIRYCIPNDETSNSTDLNGASPTLPQLGIPIGRVLIHCKYGVSRSVALAITYLMYKMKWSYHNALAHTHKCGATWCQPNSGYALTLVEFDHHRNISLSALPFPCKFYYSISPLSQVFSSSYPENAAELVRTGKQHSSPCTIRNKNLKSASLPAQNSNSAAASCEMTEQEQEAPDVDNEEIDDVNDISSDCGSGEEKPSKLCTNSEQQTFTSFSSLQLANPFKKHIISSHSSSSEGDVTDDAEEHLAKSFPRGFKTPFNSPSTASFPYTPYTPFYIPDNIENTAKSKNYSVGPDSVECAYSENSISSDQSNAPSKSSNKEKGHHRVASGSIKSINDITIKYAFHPDRSLYRKDITVIAVTSNCIYIRPYSVPEHPHDYMEDDDSIHSANLKSVLEFVEKLQRYEGAPLRVVMIKKVISASSLTNSPEGVAASSDEREYMSLLKGAVEAYDQLSESYRYLSQFYTSTTQSTTLPLPSPIEPNSGILGSTKKMVSTM